jgi:RNA polymerase sigma factor (sigma-70 family)
MAGYNNEALEWLGKNLGTVERRLRSVCGIVHDRFDSLWDDICSEIVVPQVSEFYETWDEEKGAGRLTWVVNGLRNRVRNFLQKRNGYRRKTTTVGLDASENETSLAIEQVSILKFSEEISSSAERDTLKEVMEALPETARHWLLFRASGMTFVEIGESLDLAPNTVREHYNNAVEAARRIAGRLA